VGIVSDRARRVRSAYSIMGQARTGVEYRTDAPQCPNPHPLTARSNPTGIRWPDTFPCSGKHAGTSGAADRSAAAYRPEHPHTHAAAFSANGEPASTAHARVHDAQHEAVSNARSNAISGSSCHSCRNARTVSRSHAGFRRSRRQSNGREGPHGLHCAICAHVTSWRSAVHARCSHVHRTADASPRASGGCRVSCGSRSLRSRADGKTGSYARPNARSSDVSARTHTCGRTGVSSDICAHLGILSAIISPASDNRTAARRSRSRTWPGTVCSSVCQ